MDAIDLTSSLIGEGPPLIILHGLFGSQRNWGGIARALADRATIHGLDLRNHGDSPWNDRMTYDDMAADVARHIEQKALGPVRILGHSMGGKVAMRLGLTRPELISKLIIVDIAPVTYTGNHHINYAHAMRQLPIAQIARRAEADELLRSAIPEDSLRAFLMQNLVSEEGSFRWRLNLPAIEANMADIMGFPPSDESFDKPTFFLVGERSNYVRPRDMDMIHTQFPQAELLEIAEAGHWPHAEFPARFLDMVRPLL